MSKGKGVSKVNWGREFRRFRGFYFTQAHLARALGISRRAVVYIEQGQREPRVKTVEKFKALKEKHRNARNPYTSR